MCVTSRFERIMSDRSMEPRYFPGEQLQIDRSVSVEPGCHVLIELMNGQEITRKLINFDKASFTIKQLKPEITTRLVASQIRRISRIVGYSEPN